MGGSGRVSSTQCILSLYITILQAAGSDTLEWVSGRQWARQQLSVYTIIVYNYTAGGRE